MEHRRRGRERLSPGLPVAVEPSSISARSAGSRCGHLGRPAARRRTAGPAPAGSPGRRGSAAARGTSTPSATVVIPSASESAITARTIAPDSGSSGISRRNERSILSVCTGSCRSRDSDDQPAPKSSIAICRPASSQLAQQRADPLGLAQRRRLGQLHRQPRRVDALRAQPLDQLEREVGPVQLARGDVERHPRLAGPGACHSRSWRAIAPTTHSPIGSSRLISSAAGMKRSGCTSPRSGSFQRSSASIECSRPLAVHTIGW